MNTNPNPESNSISALPTAPAPAPKRRSPLDLNQRQSEAMTLTLDICAVAQKAEYAPSLVEEGVTAQVVTALINSVEAAQGKSRLAIGSTTARKGATLSEAIARKRLVRSLQQIQSKARKAHLPDDPSALEAYHVGRRLDQNRAVLESYSHNIIAKANEERPGSINTDFIMRVQAERTAFVDANGSQSTQSGKGRGERAQRDSMVKAIIALRKAIQYAADGIWTPGNPDHVQARKDFKLPANRPYSY